jgi:hypothetical protein
VPYEKIAKEVSDKLVNNPKNENKSPLQQLAECLERAMRVYDQTYHRDVEQFNLRRRNLWKRRN